VGIAFLASNNVWPEIVTYINTPRDMALNQPNFTFVVV
jgi:hypothetical protein